MKLSAIFTTALGLNCAASALLAIGCEDPNGEVAVARRAAQKWNAPCADESVLLATTSGSPSTHKCSNKLHRMHVQVATHPSNEEAAALVFCECPK